MDKIDIKKLCHDVLGCKTSLSAFLPFRDEKGKKLLCGVLKDCYEQAKEKISEFSDLDGKTTDEMASRLSKLVTKCVKLEKPIRSQLEKICVNTINSIFAIPEETVDFSCKLKDFIPKSDEPRIKTQKNIPNGFSERNVLDEGNEDFLKRRMVDMLIIGASVKMMSDVDLYAEEVEKFDGKLIKLYEEIIAINNYLVFTDTEDGGLQMSSVDVTLGEGGLMTSIEATGRILPFLFGESIRGFFELFSTHGLPAGNDKAYQVIGMADSPSFEQWDMRLGQWFWDKMSKGIEDSKELPYYFVEVCSMEYNPFCDFIKGIVSGERTCSDLDKKVHSRSDVDKFDKKGKVKNVNNSLISDERSDGNDVFEKKIRANLLSCVKESKMLEKAGYEAYAIEEAIRLATPCLLEAFDSLDEGTYESFQEIRGCLNKELGFLEERKQDGYKKEVYECLAKVLNNKIKLFDND